MASIRWAVAAARRSCSSAAIPLHRVTSSVCGCDRGDIKTVGQDADTLFGSSRHRDVCRHSEQAWRRPSNTVGIDPNRNRVRLPDNAQENVPMPITPCADCGAPVSPTASSCPACGAALADKTEAATSMIKSLCWLLVLCCSAYLISKIGG
jgi:hypothetical protein